MRTTLTALSFFLLAGGVCAEESYSAKSLFFGEDDSVIAVSTAEKAKVASAPESIKKATKTVAHKKPANIGASYFIRLKSPDGTSRDVLSSRKFKTGERFQLGVKVNRPSYIYILNEDPSGKIVQLYPQPGGDNFVNAMGVVFLPSQGSFEFDQQPGTEQLLVYVSPTPIQAGMPERVKKMRPDVVSVLPDAAPACAPQALADNTAPTDAVTTNSDRQYASKGIAFAEEPNCVKDGAKPAASAYAAKGIAFSDDAAPTGAGAQVASYVVKKTSTPDTGLFLKIKLSHQ